MTESELVEWIRVNVPQPTDDSFEQTYAFIVAVEKQCARFATFSSRHAASKLVPRFTSALDAYLLDVALQKYSATPSEEDKLKMKGHYVLNMSFLFELGPGQAFLLEASEHMLKAISTKLRGAP